MGEDLMSASRFGAFQKATALVPLALLSAAVTASLAGVAPTTAVAEQQAPTTLPDGTSVPTEAIEAPASVSTPVSPTRTVDGSLGREAQTASASGIPAAALAAYQRAETVINAADRTCNLPWQLVAAIGRVESDHGRANGNTLDDDGLATPGIYGIALNGKNNTQAISDSDAGQYDADARWDRAVGPMQFIPSTWSVVGVDGDNDGKRNPQDIDDAALASAVYLCSGRDDLSTEAGQRASVFRYNHSDAYVDLVLSFMNAYMSGDFTSVPNGVSSAGYFAPAPVPSGGGNGPDDGKGNGNGSTGGGNSGGGEEPPAEEPPAEEPPAEEPPVTGGGDGDGDGGGDVPIDVPDLPDVPEPSLPPVDDALTEAEALAQCIADGVVDNPLTSVNELDQCVGDLLEG
jgi:membrane-bound lytic murein transglycosylase B